jgi:hypothetical protein
VLEEDSSPEAAAANIGENAVLLAQAKAQAHEAAADARAIMGFVKDTIKATVGAGTRAPDRHSELGAAVQWAAWRKVVDQRVVHFIVARVTADRLRYIMVAHDPVDDGGVPTFDGSFNVDAGLPYNGRILLTGVFVKKASGQGGGRLHLNLTNVSDTFPNGPQKDGAIHLYFANGNAGKLARRIAYRNVQARDDAGVPPTSAVREMYRHVGHGGVSRTRGVGDFKPTTTVDGGTAFEGSEFWSLNVRWKAGSGGMAAAVLGHAFPLPAYAVFYAKECWNAEGKTHAYEDNYAGNDTECPNAGDFTSCVAEYPVEEFDDVADGGTAVDAGVPGDPNAEDPDPEVDAELEANEADTVEESEAEDTTIPEGSL